MSADVICRLLPDWMEAEGMLFGTPACGAGWSLVRRPL